MVKGLWKKSISVIIAVLLLGMTAEPVLVNAKEQEQEYVQVSETEPETTPQAQEGDTVSNEEEDVVSEDEDTEGDAGEEPVDTSGWNGFHQSPNSQEWYYYTDGAPDTGVTNVIKGKVNGKTGWWFVKKGKVQLETESVEKNENGWWYIKDGRVDFSYTGFAENSSGWWRIVKGKVDFSCKDIIKGTVNKKYAWWYVKRGKVQLGVTTVERNKNGWWYIKDGKVDFSYTGFAQNSNGWWRIVKGKVNFKCKDVIQGTVNGKKAWWFVKGGKVQLGVNSVEKNKNGWWRIVNGKVNFKSNTVARNENGWWYIKNGKVDFSYSGVFTTSKNVWNIKNGRAERIPSSSMDAKAQSYSSNTNWLIMVDTKKNEVGIYTGSKGKWNWKYHWQCTTGASSSPTVKGQFTVGSKGKSFGDGYTCWYYTQFYGNYLFHSVIYQKGSMSTITDGRLGINASHGCVRLSIGHAKWIYNNIPKGTKVVVY